MCYLFIILLSLSTVLNPAEFARHFKIVVERKLQSSDYQHTPTSTRHLWQNKLKEKICTMHGRLAPDNLTFCKLSNIYEMMQAHINWYAYHQNKSKWQPLVNSHYFQLDPWQGHPYRHFLRNKLIEHIQQVFSKRVPTNLYFIRDRDERDEFFRQHERQEKLLKHLRNSIAEGCFVRISPASYLNFQASAPVYYESFADSTIAQQKYFDVYLNGLSVTIEHYLQMPYLLALLDILKKCDNKVILSHISIPLRHASPKPEQLSCDNSWEACAYPKSRKHYLEDPSCCIAFRGSNYYYLDFKPEFSNIDSGLKVHNFMDIEAEKEINNCLKRYHIPILPIEN